MTPMIDMVFLLLVFFMTVSTLAQADRNVEVDLPESIESEVPEDLSGRGTISIDAEGKIYIGSVELDLKSIQASINAAISENPELRIHIRADATASYGLIKKVLKACAEAGADEVIYATLQAR